MLALSLAVERGRGREKVIEQINHGQPGQLSPPWAGQTESSVSSPRD